jgi:type I restriction enzyme, S subunit
MGRVETNFKQTEIGLAPADWEMKEFGDVGDVRMCRRIFNRETSPSGSIPFYKIGTFGKVPDAYISQELYNEYRQRFSFPSAGDILISAAGTIGRTLIYNGEDAYFQDSNIVWIENSKTLLSNELLYHILQVAQFNTEGGTIQRLYNSILRSAKFILPADKTEQTAIANALSDADGYIESLEKLIAKKQLIKQGAMQQLLSPKPHWKPERFGDVVRVKKGQLITNETRVEGNIPVIAGGKSPAYYHNKPNRLGKTITISASGASAGYVSFHDYPIFASDCSTIEEDQNYSIEFIFFLLQLMQEKIYKMQTGGAQPHVHASDLNPIEIIIPSKKSEQLKIAKVLSDMDTEINIIAKNLTKAKNLKQGMMQQLLTGKIRLV